ncbi:MAG: hypothetical protein ACKVWV_17930 [Planctomycetota bacterium]
MLGTLGVYLAAGFVFALVFVAKGVARVDSDAAHATLGFRAVIIPGLSIFWPLFLVRWMRGDREPPPERNAHRVRSESIGQHTANRPRSMNGGAR